MNFETRLILASQSPRRVELLGQITKNFRVIPSSIEEHMEAKLSPTENVLALAREKALCVSKLHPGSWVIGADTIVVLDDRIIGKPDKTLEAKQILKQLSGREHTVLTGVAVAKDKIWQKAVASQVVFHPLSDEIIDSYIATGEPMDKAGAYAIQGEGSRLVASYRGSYSNIVGLPISEVKELLSEAGWRDG